MSEEDPRAKYDRELLEFQEAFSTLGPAGAALLLSSKYRGLSDYFKDKGMELEAGVFGDVSDKFLTIFGQFVQAGTPLVSRQDSPN